MIVDVVLSNSISAAETIPKRQAEETQLHVELRSMAAETSGSLCRALTIAGDMWQQDDGDRPIEGTVDDRKYAGQTYPVAVARLS